MKPYNYYEEQKLDECISEFCAYVNHAKNRDFDGSEFEKRIEELMKLRDDYFQRIEKNREKILKYIEDSEF